MTRQLTTEEITALIEGERKPSDPRPLAGPLDVLIQSDHCIMCLRQHGPQVTAMYTVDDEPLCAPHAMYKLSLICVDSGYKVEVAAKVPQLQGQL